ncbi:MAG: hypothetical protein XD76_0242 [candidate division TA06 bacterium 32_111]|uniref:Uncharacterized protein n=1 Tax=candidate division TA06 bacterium 34_109 TaxID=1635277 RepID=A0A101I2V4_UNCT6|nr:MAG: hypothetical protein XD76_0242 [candidate division TA06 bacterium 32_111]KUK86865.1 MAG: hypothetical protein XE03_1228 [candidate division TA06 bacterium 34_109]
MLRKGKGLLKIKNFVGLYKVLVFVISFSNFLLIFADYRYSYNIKEYFEDDSTSFNFDIYTKENSLTFKSENLKYVFKENVDTFYLVNEENKSVTFLSFSFFDFFSTYVDKSDVNNRKISFVNDTTVEKIPVRFFTIDFDSSKSIKLFVTKEKFDLSKVIKRYNRILKSYLNVDFDLIFDSLFGGIPVLFKLFEGNELRVSMHLLNYEKSFFEREFIIPSDYKINR